MAMLNNQTVSLFRGTTCRIYRFQVENIHAPHYDVDGNPNFYWFEAWKRTRMLKQHEGWLVVTGTMEFDDFPYVYIYMHI